MKKLIAVSILFFIYFLLFTSADWSPKDQFKDLDTLLEEQLNIASSNNGIAYYQFPESGDLLNIPQDSNNPLTKEKIELGKFLFYEPALSTDVFFDKDKYSFSCATCHLPQHGFQAGIRQSIGAGGLGIGVDRKFKESYLQKDKQVFVDIQLVRSPAALNTAFHEVMGWAGSLGGKGDVNKGTENRWDRSIIEFNNNLGFEGIETISISALTVHHFRADNKIKKNPTYKKLFQAAFPNTPKEERFEKKPIGLAMAAYQRSILSNEAPFQKWLKGEKDALSIEAKKGAILFFGKAGCSNCHNGPALNGDTFHGLGMYDLSYRKEEGTLFRQLDVLGAKENPSINRSMGRGGFTLNEADNFKFKVPQLYNLKEARFYGHGGSFQSIKTIIDYKNKAVKENKSIPDSQLSEHFKPLGLSEEEILQLTKFIEDGLYDPNLIRYQPDIVPSGLVFPNT